MSKIVPFCFSIHESGYEYKMSRLHCEKIFCRRSVGMPRRACNGAGRVTRLGWLSNGLICGYGYPPGPPKLRYKGLRPLSTPLWGHCPLAPWVGMPRRAYNGVGRVIRFRWLFHGFCAKGSGCGQRGSEIRRTDTEYASRRQPGSGCPDGRVTGLGG